jgi:uncharacterized protein (TIRG00374 family)
MYLAIIGFFINTLVIIFLIMLAVNEKIVFNIVKFFINILAKMRIVKNVDKQIDKFKDIVDEFREQFKIMRTEKIMILKTAIYTAIEITVLYSITYVVYRAFGQNNESFITILSAQALLSLVTVYMPTPGAGVAAEGGFYIMFNTFFQSNTINLSILFWRMYTFYLPIFVGIVFFLNKPKELKKEKIN